MRQKLLLIFLLCLVKEQKDWNRVYTKYPIGITLLLAAPRLELGVPVREVHACLRQQIGCRVAGRPVLGRLHLGDRVHDLPTWHERGIWLETSLMVHHHDWLACSSRSARARGNPLVLFLGPKTRDQRCRAWVALKLVQLPFVEQRAVLVVLAPVFIGPISGDLLSFLEVGVVAVLIVHGQRRVLPLVEDGRAQSLDDGLVVDLRRGVDGRRNRFFDNSGACDDRSTCVRDVRSCRCVSLDVFSPLAKTRDESLRGTVSLGSEALAHSPVRGHLGGSRSATEDVRAKAHAVAVRLDNGEMRAY
jgi:hypothetical protein